MPRETPAPLDRQIEAPQVRGVSSAAREARKAEERPASEKTLAIMPGMGDIARQLGVKLKSHSPAPEKDESETDEEDEESDEEEEGSEEENEEEGADTDTEEEEESEEEEEDSEEEEEEDDDLPEKAQQMRKSMQKRIDKLTAKNTNLQTQLEELQEELESARGQSGRVEPSPADPLADVMSERELTTALDEARRVKQWCLRNRDGAEVSDGKGGTTTYTADQISDLLANAEAILDAAPQRKEWLTQHSHAQQMARDLAPEFFKKGSQEQQIFSKALESVPANVRAWRPDFDLIIIQALVGASVLSQRKAGKKPAAAKPGEEKPKPSAKPAPPAPGGKVAPKTSTRAVEKKQRQKQLRKVSGGSMRDLTSALLDRI